MEDKPHYESFDEALASVKKELLTDFLPTALGFFVLGVAAVFGVITLIALAIHLWQFAGLPW